MIDNESIQFTSRVACPYCHSHAYRLTLIPYAGGLIVRGMCENCGLRGESMSEALSQLVGSDVLNQVRTLELKE